MADVESIMAMKMEVMLRRMKFRDYYDIYSCLKEGFSIKNGIERALEYSRHRLSSKNIVARKKLSVERTINIDTHLRILLEKFNL